MNFDVLVCDDMGTEIANHRGRHAGRRVVTIHGKAFGETALGSTFKR